VRITNVSDKIVSFEVIKDLYSLNPIGTPGSQIDLDFNLRVIKDLYTGLGPDIKFQFTSRELDLVKEYSKSYGGIDIRNFTSANVEDFLNYDEVGPQNFDAVNQSIENIGGNFKTIKGFLTQTSDQAPVFTEVENNTGVTLNFRRTDRGQYSVSLPFGQSLRASKGSFRFGSGGTGINALNLITGDLSFKDGAINTMNIYTQIFTYTPSMSVSYSDGILKGTYVELIIDIFI